MKAVQALKNPVIRACILVFLETLCFWLILYHIVVDDAYVFPFLCAGEFGK